MATDDDPTQRLVAALADADKASMLQRCQRFVKYAEENSPMVRLLVKNIKDRGCTVKEDGFFACGIIDKPVLGAFDTESAQVVLNARYMTSQGLVSRTMVHEAIHGFDQCRVKLDPDNCAHIACTEIRAANLSTDCSWREEVGRGTFRIQGQQQNPDKVVESVFAPCYADTEPFGGIPS